MVQPYRAATGCEAMRRRGCMMQMGLSHGSKDTIKFLPKLQKSSSKRSSHALLTQPLSCEAVGGRLPHQTQQSWRSDRFLGSGLTHFVPNRLNRSTGGAIERQ